MMIGLFLLLFPPISHAQLQIDGVAQCAWSYFMWEDAAASFSVLNASNTTWTPSPPVSISLIGEVGGAAVENLGTFTDNETAVNWLCDIPAGTTLIVNLRDNTGVTANSANFTVQYDAAAIEAPACLGTNPGYIGGSDLPLPVSSTTYLFPYATELPPISAPVQCHQFSLQWLPTVAPFVVSLLRQVDGPAVEHIGNFTDSESVVEWTVDFPADTFLVLHVVDGDGSINDCVNFTVGTSSDTSCLGRNPGYVGGNGLPPPCCSSASLTPTTTRISLVGATGNPQERSTSMPAPLTPPISSHQIIIGVTIGCVIGPLVLAGALCYWVTRRKRNRGQASSPVVLPAMLVDSEKSEKLIDTLPRPFFAPTHQSRDALSPRNTYHLSRTLPGSALHTMSTGPDPLSRSAEGCLNCQIRRFPCDQKKLSCGPCEQEGHMCTWDAAGEDWIFAMFSREQNLNGQLLEQCKDDQRIRSGSFGWVFKNRLSDGRIVAVKCPIPHKRRIKRLLVLYVREAVTWSRLTHPNIMPLIGITTDPFANQVCLVSTWMMNGNIMEYVVGNPKVDRLTLLWQISRAVSYIHGQSIVHGDLKGNNVLISNDGDALLTDFGLSYTVDQPEYIESKQTSTMKVANPRWAAPEQLRPERYHMSVFDSHTSASDVFSMFRTFLEILTGEPPFPGKSEVEVVMLVAASVPYERPGDYAKLHGLNDKLWALMVKGWHDKPIKRPLASAVEIVLRSLKES